ncbi:unnamed protein product [Polarella glacialis]|uniref:Cellulase n=1 Tax=Polarella glacialis TaxID=89957 RepID=A0A813D2C5_POLGL|nr:unnamed protein product [Polarella glacialis]
MISISTYLAPALLLQSLLIFAPLSVQVLARLGQPNETNATEATEAQPLDASFNSTSGAEAEELQLISETGLMNFTLGSSALGGYGGYSQFATSTSYGDSSKAACGGLHTGELVSGTRYYNVASAQSMWKGCKTHGNCWCGASGGGSGTLGMGCFSCAKGRFLRSFARPTARTAAACCPRASTLPVTRSLWWSATFAPTLATNTGAQKRQGRQTTMERTTTWTFRIRQGASTTTTLSSRLSNARVTSVGASTSCRLAVAELLVRADLADQMLLSL